MSPVVIDNGMVILANTFNFLVIGVFLSRAAGRRRLEWILGIGIVILGLPAGIGAISNCVADRDWWTFVLPALLLCYCVLEFMLDYMLKLDFRNTNFLWIYLIVFYSGAVAMIGYSFGVNKVYGFATLATYLLGLGAAWYSYSRVGHGRSGAESSRIPDR